MEILLQPTIDNLREDLGYDEYDDVEEEALLFQQGYDGDLITVDDGEEHVLKASIEGSDWKMGYSITYFIMSYQTIKNCNIIIIYDLIIADRVIFNIIVL